MSVAPNVTIVYYSATGGVHRLAEAVAEGARSAGAEVRLRHVAETVPGEVIAGVPGWAAHREAVGTDEVASHDDLTWADAIVFGSPTRYGLPAAQLKAFIDATGPLWAQGLLADKVYSSFTSTATPHGGQESTLLALNNVVYHYGGVVVPPGYTDPLIFASTGNPYGTSFTSHNGTVEPSDAELDAARYQGARVARYAADLKAGRAVRAAAAAPEQRTAGEPANAR